MMDKKETAPMSFDEIKKWEKEHPCETPPKETLEWLRENSSMADGLLGALPYICDTCLNKIGFGCDVFDDVNDVNETKDSGKCEWYIRKLKE